MARRKRARGLGSSGMAHITRAQHALHEGEVIVRNARRQAHVGNCEAAARSLVEAGVRYGEVFADMKGIPAGAKPAGNVENMRSRRSALLDEIQSTRLSFNQACLYRR